MKIYDVIIIGSGPAGMTASLYASRANLSVLILEKGIPGGELNNTAEIENYPGYPSINGPELAEKMNESSLSFGAEYAYGDVVDVVLENNIKIIKTTNNKEYRAYTIIISTGATHQKLNIPGEEHLMGRGVSYCAVCDGAFFKDKNIIVVGGGDSAVEEGSYLTQYAKSVTIVHRRDKLRATPTIQDRAMLNNKIKWLLEYTLEEIKGENNVKSVILKNTKTLEVYEHETDGVFIYVGIEPNIQPFKNLNLKMKDNYILTKDNMETNIKGIYAVGDVRYKNLRQVVTAVSDGAIAGQQVYNYIENMKDKRANEK